MFRQHISAALLAAGGVSAILKIWFISFLTFYKNIMIASHTQFNWNFFVFFLDATFDREPEDVDITSSELFQSPQF